MKYRMNKTAASLKEILKKEALQSSALSCDSWLLPEIESGHIVHGKETRKVKKNAGQSIPKTDQHQSLDEEVDDKSENAPSDEIDSKQDVEQSEVQPLDAQQSATDITHDYKNINIEENLVPQRLSEFDEQLTLKKLQSKSDAIQREAWIKGHKEGMHAGIEEAKSSIENLQVNLSNQIEQLVAQLDGLLNNQQQSLQSALHNVIIQIVEKITTISFQQNPEALDNILQEALENYPKNAEKPIVRLCENDLNLLRDNNLLVDSCIWEADASVSPGGFLVVGKYAEIDHSFETRLQQIIDQYFSK